MTRKASVIAILFLVLAAAAPGTGQDVTPKDETAAREAFGRLMTEITGSQGRVPMEQLIEMTEVGMLGILKQHPGTAASGSARVILGQLYASIGRADDALKHLRAYFDDDYAKDPNEIHMARLFLGTASLALEDFEGAEKAFRAVMESAGVNPQVAQMAAGNLAALETRKKLRLGAPVIEFSADDITGRRLSTSDYSGKVFLIDFWATWCAPCHAEMPNIKKVYNDYRGKGFDIIGISLDTSREALLKYVERQKLDWRQIYDGGQAGIGRLYAVNAIPATFLIDRQGRIRYKNLRGDELERAVRALLEEKESPR